MRQEELLYKDVCSNINVITILREYLKNRKNTVISKGSTTCTNHIISLNFIIYIFS